MTSAPARFDTAGEPFVSFVPLRQAGRRGPAGNPGVASGRDEAVVNEFPISRAKVTPPPVREETLARERLLTWLETAIRRRVVYVVAEAGYGKTTLLADFHHRTLVRCLWFKLDDTDRDWRTFLHYLVAAGREAVPDFGAATSQLLAEESDDDSARQRATDSLASELEQLADRPTALILDDYQLVDGAAEVTRILQRLLRSLPESMSLVFLSRRRPSLRVARMRALDEVRELGLDDLRFSRDETDRLFSEAYNQPLETDVLDEVDSRAEGWAASLQMVRSGIRGRSPAEVRAFVQRMAGAEGSLYDYLAEEVVGELPAHLRRFLMRTSVLDRVTPELARAALSTGPDTAPTLHDTRGFIQQAEVLGLLSRRGESTRWSHRYHPLIRDYLTGKLAEELEPDEIREIHRAIAREAETTSWAVAAHHWLEAGDTTEMVQVIERQIAAIASSGQYSRAARFLHVRDDALGQVARIVQARVTLLARRPEPARERLAEARERPEAFGTQALFLLLSTATSLADLAAKQHLSGILLERPDLEDWQAAVVTASLAVDDAQGVGPLSRAIDLLSEAADLHERQQRWHLAAISRFNLADTRYVAAQYDDAERDVRVSIEHMRRSGGDASELGPAFALSSAALLAIGHTGLAQQALQDALAQPPTPLYALELGLRHSELLIELGDLETAISVARRAVADARTGATRNVLAMISTAGADVATKTYAFDAAEAWLAGFAGDHPAGQIAGRSHQLIASARLELLTNRAMALERATQGLDSAVEQGAWHLAHRAALIVAAARREADQLTAVISQTARVAPSALRSEAAALSGVLDLVDPVPPELESAIAASPAAWRPHFRHRLGDEREAVRHANARLLDEFGERLDLARIRAVSANAGASRQVKQLGKRLARRTALPVFVDDLGRTRLFIGERVIEITSLRRKVASLVVYLMTRPGFTATREQVLEALWPDSTPSVGTNSLHQTIYFLRRDLEPGYTDELSPGYVRLEGELVWLDPQLVDSASHRFASISSSTELEVIVSAIRQYRGRFAPEFEYEEWAIATRDALHAAYLQVVDRALKEFVAVRAWREAADVARLALAVDPAADEIERSLIAVYERSGAHAAAAEQYAHFAIGQREELGVEPPPLDEIRISSDRT